MSGSWRELRFHLLPDEAGLGGCALHESTVFGKEDKKDVGDKDNEEDEEDEEDQGVAGSVPKTTSTGRACVELKREGRQDDTEALEGRWLVSSCSSFS